MIYIYTYIYKLPHLLSWCMSGRTLLATEASPQIWLLWSEVHFYSLLVIWLQGSVESLQPVNLSHWDSYASETEELLNQLPNLLPTRFPSGVYGGSTCIGGTGGGSCIGRTISSTLTLLPCDKQHTRVFIHTCPGSSLLLSSSYLWVLPHPPSYHLPRHLEKELPYHTFPCVLTLTSKLWCWHLKILHLLSSRVMWSAWVKSKSKSLLDCWYK